MRNTPNPTVPRVGGHGAAPHWGAPLTSLLSTLVLIVGLLVPSGPANAAAPSGIAAPSDIAVPSNAAAPSDAAAASDAAAPSDIAAPSTVVGAACAPGSGVTAVVDFEVTDADTAAPVKIGCAPGAQPNIRAAFVAAGFDLGSAAFVCEIDGALPSPSDCTTYRGAYWSMFTSTDTGTFPGAEVTGWNDASTGVDNGAPVPVGSAVLFQIQPDAPNRTPRIALAELGDHAAAPPSEGSSEAPSTSSSPTSSTSASSGASAGSSTSSPPDTSSASDTSSSAPSTAPSTEQSTAAPSASSTGTTSTSPVTTPGTSATDPTLPPTTTTTDARPLAAAHWLGQQLANAPNGLFGNVDYPDYGLTIDALLALSAAGVGGDLITSTATRIRSSGEDYLGAADDTANNSGRIAKTALALQVAGLDPTTFPSTAGPRDLIAELRGTLNADGSFGSSDFPFVHSLAIHALARTPEGVPASAVSWLQDTQCSTVGNENFGAYGYDGIDPCAGVDGDGTALAIQALAAADVPATDPSIKDAGAYLLSIQGANGGVPSSFGGINTNNTGLAAQALDRVQIAPGATARMTVFVSSLQVQCATLAGTGNRFSDKDLGAIAYSNEGGFDSPITTPDFDNRDQWIRATTQAIFAYHLPSLDRITAVAAQPALPAAPICAPTTTSSAPSTTPTTAGSMTAPSTGAPATGAPATGAPATTAPATTAPSATAPSTTALSTAVPSATRTAPTTSSPDGGTSSAAPFPGSISLSTGTVVAGGSLTVTVTGAFIGTRHRVELHSTPVLLGTLVTDAVGDGSLTVRIPAGTAPGQHEIVLTAGGFVAAVALTVTAATAATDRIASSTPAPITTPVDPASTPLPNTGVSEGLHTLLIIGGLLVLFGAALLVLGRRRTRSRSGSHLS